MIDPTMSMTDAGGWIALALLTVILLIQTRVFRGFRRPQTAALADWPSLSVVLRAKETDTLIRAAIAGISAVDYRGDLEILVISPASLESESLSQLSLASSRVRILDASPFSAIAAEARGEWILDIPSSVQLEKDAIERLISTAVEDGLDAVILSPRIDAGSLRGFLKDPLLIWLELTLRPLFARRRTLEAGRSVLLATRERCLTANADDVFSSAPLLDGFDSASTGGLAHDSYLDALRSSAGGGSLGLFILALGLPLLFTLPIIAAVATRSFPWIVAATMSYWIRFRVAARSGEPIPLAFFHPLAVILLSGDLMRGVARKGSRRNNNAAQT